MATVQSLIEILQRENIHYRTLTHDPVITISDVEKTLGIDPASMAKALIVRTPDGFCTAVIPGNCQLSKKNLAKISGYSRSSLDLVPKNEVELTVGLPIGSIPPYGLGLSVFMDEKLLMHNPIYCGVGSLTMTLEVSPVDLCRLSDAKIGLITL